jgi:hypothetical protein
VTKRKTETVIDLSRCLDPLDTRPSCRPCSAHKKKAPREAGQDTSAIYFDDVFAVCADGVPRYPQARPWGIRGQYTF